MSSNERAPLINGRNGSSNNGHHRSLSGSMLSFIKGEGEPGWGSSMKFFFFSWFNILLVFVPLSATAHYGNWDAKFRFSFSFLAIIPLAKLLGDATEQLSVKLGPTLGGLLNASFGNAVEIIVGIAALLQGELRIVQTSMIGSILSNLLLVLGMSFFAGGLIHHRSHFKVSAAQTSSSLMTLSCITLVIPAAYQASKSSGKEPFLNLSSILNHPDDPPNPDNGSLSGLLTISRGTSILLLIVYASYLVFQLKTHSDLFESTPEEEEDEERNNGYRQSEPEEEQKMNSVSAAISLLAVTVITSFCADYLVASIEETAEQYHIPKPFIGLILIPLVANAAEHVTSVWMAMKNKMMLAISISLGSSIQIATFVVPLLVIIGWIVGKDLTLFFADFETIVLFVSVLLVNILIMDGESNYMEGLLCIVLYVVIGLAFWVS